MPPYRFRGSSPSAWARAARVFFEQQALAGYFPKSSPDLNHVEGVWHLVKQEVEAKAPAGQEKRGVFLARLRRTVARMNKAGASASVASNRKERASDVVTLKGAKSKW